MGAANAPGDNELLTAGNLPSLDRLAYRPDDYERIRTRLLAALAQAFPTWNPSLIEARGAADPGVALCELFAHLGDILGCYQDAFANESFLRTARLPASLAALGALIDYRPAPGASATGLQLFELKPGATGELPLGYRLKAPARTDRPALVFETTQVLKADAARNRLKFFGHDHSDRELRLSTGGVELPDSYAVLDQAYDGLNTGTPIVFSGPTTAGATVVQQAVAINGLSDQDGLPRIDWTPPAVGELRFPISDLTIHGKPKQTMALAARERADEIRVGQQSAAVLGSAIALNDLVLFSFNGIFEAAKIINKSGAVITWNRGFMIPLRRSATRLYTATTLGTTGAALRPGSTTIPINFATSSAASALDLQGGDHLLLADAFGVERVTVAALSNVMAAVYGGPYTRYANLAQPLARSLQANATVARVRLPDSGLSTGLSPETSFKPVTFGDIGVTDTLELDRTYEGLTAGTLVAASDGTRECACTVTAVSLAADGRSVVTLAAALDPAFEAATFTLYGPFEYVMRVDGYNRAEGDTAPGLTQLELDGVVPGLEAGGYLVVEGGGHAEGVRIANVQWAADKTVVGLRNALVLAYPLADTVIYGNVAPITHGEGLSELIVGSGDPSQAGQRFTLKRGPVSFTSDPTQWRGLASSLEVIVDDERWTEVPSLAESGPGDRHYVTEVDEDQKLTLLFGDGVHGARLPSGRDNVRVRYRVGLGAAGNLASGDIPQPAQALPFLASTRNPISTAGGADREDLEQTRRLAPITVRTLDRFVTLPDFADGALAFGGIAKARADWGWEQGRRVVVLTVASVGGNALTPQLLQDLRGYIDARRSPHHRLRIRDYQPHPVRLKLTVQVLANFRRAEIQRRILQALGAGVDDDGKPGYFHFERRDLGGDLYLSDIYGLAERLPGVDNALASQFHFEDESESLNDRLVIPPTGLATGGHATDAALGRLQVDVTGGFA